MAKTNPEDHLLDERQFPDLNRTFYASEPADYFERRLHLLALQAGNWNGLYGLFKDGVTVGDLTIKDDGMPEDEEMSRRIVDHYTVAESELLAHQVGETLLRLYLAHEFDGSKPPACPRLDLARVRSEEFRRRVERRFGDYGTINDPQRRRGLARVFHLTTERESLRPDPPSEAEWNASLDLYEGYLRHFAEQFLRGAPLYNAAKHGLALTPDEIGMEIKGIAKRHGPSIRYLTVVRSESDPRPRWHEAVHWIDSDRQMIHTYRACTMIRNLWRIARHRYRSPATAEFGIGLLSGPSAMEVTMKGRAAGVISDMSVRLRYVKVAR